MTEIDATPEHLRNVLRAARKCIDPVIQYRLIEAIDNLLALITEPQGDLGRASSPVPPSEGGAGLHTAPVQSASPPVLEPLIRSGEGKPDGDTGLTVGSPVALQLATD